MKKWSDWSAIGLQALFLLSILFTYYQVLWTGEEISLQSKPIDPYDIFRGAYVYLQYEEEDIPHDRFHPQGSVDFGDLVYVTFKQEGNQHRVDQVLAAPPAHSSYLIATYHYYDPYAQRHHLDYNLSRYYTTEEEAIQLERENGHLLVHLYVKNGRGVISDIEVMD